MRTQNTVLVAFMALALIVSPAAIAQYGHEAHNESTRDQNQRNQQQEKQDRQASRNFQPKLCQANELIGATVTNPQGEEIGNIKDLVMDSQHRNVSYAVLAFGGFLGLGEDLRAIPWQALTIERGEQNNRANRDQDGEITIVLNATKEQLENAEGFSDDNWPDMGDEKWNENVRSSFYGQNDMQRRESMAVAGRNMDANRRNSDYADQRDNDYADRRNTNNADQRNNGYADRSNAFNADDNEAMESRRLSNILGETVSSSRDEDIGEIENILVDVNRGDLAYAIVDVSDFDDLGDTEQVAIPWRSLQTRGDQLTMTAAVASLNRMQYGEDGRMQLESRNRASKQHALCNSEPYWESPGDENQRYGHMHRNKRDKK